ncbi:hypothetical protein MG293_020597 [Ovis ammon polii]|uniref:Uncharacterized protein n=1 Tax=Ovis ammon polii TaxID=230172 RepID=A0AAD4TMU0_OVIAM|nr:hypothetical protein MG293_020597 [Ovis ammon polii]KAI4550219.1 hypothetical protein MJT46_018945 [Ovis ammon polii x Ovis aries]
MKCGNEENALILRRYKLKFTGMALNDHKLQGTTSFFLLSQENIKFFLVVLRQVNNTRIPRLRKNSKASAQIQPAAPKLIPVLSASYKKHKRPICQPLGPDWGGRLPLQEKPLKMKKGLPWETQAYRRQEPDAAQHQSLHPLGSLDSSQFHGPQAPKEEPRDLSFSLVTQRR